MLRIAGKGKTRDADRQRSDAAEWCGLAILAGLIILVISLISISARVSKQEDRAKAHEKAQWIGQHCKQDMRATADDGTFDFVYHCDDGQTTVEHTTLHAEEWIGQHCNSITPFDPLAMIPCDRCENGMYYGSQDVTYTCDNGQTVMRHISGKELRGHVEAPWRGLGLLGGGKIEDGK